VCLDDWEGNLTAAFGARAGIRGLPPDARVVLPDDHIIEPPYQQPDRLPTRRREDAPTARSLPAPPPRHG
jgi:hypothetical protein